MVYGYNQTQNNMAFGMMTNQPAMQKKQQQNSQNVVNPYNQQNFGAIDTEKIKQDTVELAGRASEQANDNGFVKAAKNIVGGKGFKKFMTSLGLTFGTVVGLAALGNSKFSVHKLPEIGINVAESLDNNGLYKSITGFFKKGKDGTLDILRKSKSFQDIEHTLKVNKAKPKWSIARGQGQGMKTIFSLTPPDILKHALGGLGNEAEKLKSLKKLTGSDKKAKELLTMIEKSMDLNGEQLTNVQICNRFTDMIKDNFGCKNHKDLLNILSQLEEGKITGLDGKLSLDMSEFTGVLMDSDGKGLAKLQDIMGSWWPVNFIDKAGKKIMGDSWKPFCKGNLGNSLIKYNVISDNLASNKVGSLIQKSLLFPTESISNFVNDKSGMGALLCLQIMSLYNSAQDAPEGKKASVVAHDYMGTMGSLAFTMPMAFGLTYGVASMGNAEGKTLFTKILKPVGKFFGIGLDPVINGRAVEKTAKTAVGRGFQHIKNGGGGVMRFMLISMVLQGIFSKPITAAINKVFGKPYDPVEAQQEEAQKAQAEAMKNLNMTEEQALQKLQAHPEIIQALQSSPEAMAQIQQNPMLLLELLASIPDEPAAQIPGGQMSNASTSNDQLQQVSKQTPPSQLLQSYVNNPNNRMQSNSSLNTNTMQESSARPNADQVHNNSQSIQPQRQRPASTQNDTANAAKQNIKAPENTQPEATAEPARTYIPSSKPFNYNETATLAAQSNATQVNAAADAESKANNLLDKTSGISQNDANTPVNEADITNQNVLDVLDKADKAMDDAMKYL